MANYQEEVAKSLELQKQVRDVKADINEAARLEREAGALVVELEAKVRAGFGHSQVRDELKAATDERDAQRAARAQFHKRLDDLNADYSRASVASERARTLQTKHGLTQSEFEQVFDVYFEGGTYEAARRLAVELATKAAGKVAAESPYAFNAPGSVRW